MRVACIFINITCGLHATSFWKLNTTCFSHAHCMQSTCAKNLNKFKEKLFVQFKFQKYLLNVYALRFACGMHAICMHVACKICNFACENVSLTFFFACKRSYVKSAPAEMCYLHVKVLNFACESHKQKLHVKYDVLVRKMMFRMRKSKISHASHMNKNHM